MKILSAGEENKSDVRQWVDWKYFDKTLEALALHSGDFPEYNLIIVIKGRDLAGYQLV